jgi:hypothetical protein
MSQLRVTGNAIISGAGQSLQLTSASDVYLNVTRGASILNIGIDATSAFYNTNTSHKFFVNSGTINALTLGSTGAATFSGVGNRPVTIDGNVNIKADAGGWAMQHGFTGSLGTERGGFGAYGSADALSYYYIGVYGAEKLKIDYTTGIATFSSSVDATQFSSIGRGTSFGYKLPDWQIYNTTSGNRLTFNNYSADLLTIASTGAATFSSSVTAGTQFIGSNTTTDPTVGITTATVYALNGPSSNNTFGIGIGAIRNSAYDMWFQTGAANGGGYRWYIGTNEKMTMSSTGNVLIGTTTDSGEKLQVNGITKTNGLSLGATTFSSNTTMTSDYYFWEFTGGAGVTLTLYSSSGNNNTHFIKNGSGVSLTISGTIYTLSSGAPTSSITLAAYKTIQLISRGGGSWYIMYQTT